MKQKIKEILGLNHRDTLIKKESAMDVYTAGGVLRPKFSSFFVAFVLPSSGLI